MLTLLFAAVMAAPLGRPCPATVGMAPRVLVAVGLQKVLTVGPAATFQVVPVGPVEVKVLTTPSGGPTQLLLIGVEEGDAVLTVESGGSVSRWNVVVDVHNIDDMIVGFRQYFPCGTRMRWKRVAGRTQLFGKASSLAEWMGARRTQRESPQILVLGSLDPTVIAWTIGEANAALTQAGLSLHYVHDGDAVMLVGEVPDAHVKEFAAVEAKWRDKLSAAVWKPKNLP